MLVRYRDGKVPGPGPGPTPLDRAGGEAMEAYREAMDGFDLRSGAEAIASLVTRANQYIVQTVPWVLARENRGEELDSVLGSLARCLARLALLASPFVPAPAEQLWQSLGRPGTAAGAGWDQELNPDLAGAIVSRPPVLFPKRESVP